jgi:hypothetical protein
MSSTFDAGEDFVAPALDMEDLQGFLMTLQAQGWPEGLLIKQAIVSIRALHAASDRWQKMEYGYSASAPLWLDQKEAAKLVDLLRGQKSVEARSIRQALGEMFP